jgi:alpha-L-arabinofuranosidase
MRAANGQPQPFSVKYWEIGNEIWGDWVRGHSNAETYVRNYKRYYDSMRAVDPTICFIAVVVGAAGGRTPRLAQETLA